MKYVTKHQADVLAGMRDSGGASWFADQATGAGAGTLVSAWWRTMRTLESQGLVRRVLHKNGEFAQGFELIVEQADALLPRNLVERFWSRIDRTSGDGCWLWTGNTNPRGYGTMRVGERTRTASRLVYELTHGPVPSGICVCHHCDNPPCCNPGHMFLGTHGDNARDRARKGRGATNGRRLTDAHVAEIIALHRAGGISMRKLGERFGCSAVHAARIVRGLARVPYSTRERLAESLAGAPS